MKWAAFSSSTCKSSPFETKKAQKQEGSIGNEELYFPDLNDWSLCLDQKDFCATVCLHSEAFIYDWIILPIINIQNVDTKIIIFLI